MPATAMTRIKSLETTIKLIELLVREEGGRVSAIAEQLDRPKSTVSDHLRSLEDLNYVYQDETLTYRITAKFLRLGEHFKYAYPVSTEAIPIINKMSFEIGEHTSLLVEEQGRGIVLHISEGENNIDIGGQAGIRTYLHSNAPGKAILAHLPKERVREIVDRHGLPAVTPNTITNESKLFDELTEIREHGISIDRGERIQGMGCVGVPILIGERLRGAICICSPLNHLEDPDRREEFEDRVQEAANIIELNLRYATSDD